MKITDDQDNGPGPSQVPLAERHPPIWWVSRRMQFHLDALREILNDNVSRLGELDEKHFSVDALVAIKDLPEEKRQELQKYVDDRIAEARAGDPPIAMEDGASDGADRVESETEETMRINLDMGRIDEIFEGDRHFTGAFMQELEHLAAGPRRVTILHNSLLAMAIGAFEVLVSGIATQFFVHRPERLESGEKVFSFAELRDFDDVDDAADEIISRRIASLLMNGGIDAWSDWFKKNCDADLADLAMDFPAVTEAFQRRHVVLHNGGLASRQYLQNVPDAKVVVGERLPVDQPYLNRVFDELDVLGTSLGALAEGTWQPEKRDEVANLLLRRCFELMVEKRWDAAEKLATLGKRLKCKSVLRSSLQCNEWLCRSERFGDESIRDEVEQFDTSDMAPRFQLVKQIFLGELDLAMDSVASLVKSKEITRGELATWPILRKVREHPKFQETLTAIDSDQ